MNGVVVVMVAWRCQCRFCGSGGGGTVVMEFVGDAGRADCGFEGID